jgi:hypothetical protein
MRGVLIVEEMAGRLKVAPKTVHDWRAIGKLRRSKAGTQWHFPGSDLQNLADP